MKKTSVLTLFLFCLFSYGQQNYKYKSVSLNLPKSIKTPTSYKKKIITRAATSNDTIQISHAWYTLNWNQSQSLNTGGNLYTAFGTTSVQMSSITNYLNPKSYGSYKEVFTLYDTMFTSGLSTANNFIRRTYIIDSSVSVTIDTVMVVCGLSAIDSNNVAGDTISFSLFDVDKDTKTRKGLIKKIEYTSFADLKKFVNGGLLYFANIPFKTKLADSVKAFGINIEYKTVHKDSNTLLVAYNYSDSCINVTIGGQNYRSPAMRPLFTNYTQWMYIDSTSPTTVSLFSGNNGFSYSVASIPPNCRYVYTQNFYLFPSVIVESKFYGSLATSPIKNTFCANEAITISPDIQGGKAPFTYKWSATTGTIDNDTDPAIILTLGTANSNVKLVLKDANGDSLTLTRTITVSNPTVSISASKSTLTTCKDSAILTAIPSTGSFSWSGSSSTTNRLTVKAAGSYTVTITNSFGCSAISNALAITSTAPSITLSYNYTPTTNVCINKDVSFTNTSANTSGWDFSWKDGSTEISTDAASFTHQFTSAGTKSVSLNATTTSGCVATPISKNIVVKTCVGIEENLFKSICQGESYLGRSVSGTYIDTLKSSIFGGFDTLRVLSLTVNPKTFSTVNETICQGSSFLGRSTSGIYIDTLIGANSYGCDSIRTLNLTIHPIPNPTILKTGNVLSTQSFKTYQWLLNGVNIIGATTQSYSVAVSGNYQVAVNDTNNCVGVSSVGAVIVSSLNEVDKDCFKIYPNPFSELLNIEVSHKDHIEYLLTTVDGKVINKDKFKERYKIDTKKLASGTYFLIIKDKDQSESFKIIKK
jgi:hypothetical protein